MNVLIPMAGLGSRFVRAGYEEIKPLIPVLGKPMIKWVARIFPGSHFTFVCRDQHLAETNVEQVLKEIDPHCKIFGVPGDKKGPVSTLLQADPAIFTGEPVIVSYCDYYMRWNYQDFLEQVAKNDCEAWLPCYTGFHPHLLPEKNLYASCRVDENMEMIELKEKFSFEKDKTKALHSPGIHYFKTGKLLQETCQALVDSGSNVGGEFYASLLMQTLKDQGARIKIYSKIDHFCQWGTPEDLKEFNFWINDIKKGSS